MKKIIFTFLFYCTSILAYSQVDSVNIDSFVIVSPGKLHNNINSSNTFLDNRDTDTLDVGYIIQQKYEGNFIFNIRPGYSLKEQFTCLLDSFNTAMKSNRQLLLQLSRLKFSGPRNDNFKQKRFLFRANLYELSEKGYSRLGSIDTVAKINVRNNKRFILNCFNAARSIVTAFIGSSLSKSVATASEYITLSQIKKIDSAQKSWITLYKTDTLVEGVYACYQSLKDQKPEYTEFDITMKDEIPVEVERLNINNSNMRHSFGSIYAVVINNKIFIYDNSKYYLLEKRSGDFFFKTIVKTDKMYPYGSPFSGLIFQALVIIGNATSKVGDTEYEMKLDHLDGSFIPYKMIKK